MPLKGLSNTLNCSVLDGVFGAALRLAFPPCAFIYGSCFHRFSTWVPSCSFPIGEACPKVSGCDCKGEKLTEAGPIPKKEYCLATLAGELSNHPVQLEST